MTLGPGLMLFWVRTGSETTSRPRCPSLTPDSETGHLQRSHGMTHLLCWTQSLDLNKIEAHFSKTVFNLTEYVFILNIIIGGFLCLLHHYAQLTHFLGSNFGVSFWCMAWHGIYSYVELFWISALPFEWESKT